MSVSVLGQAPPWATSWWGRLGAWGRTQLAGPDRGLSSAWPPPSKTVATLGPALARPAPLASPPRLSLRQTLGQAFTTKACYPLVRLRPPDLGNLQKQFLQFVLEFANIRETGGE